MDAYRIFATPRTAVISLSIALLLAGCKSTPPATDDASLNAKVASSLAADRNLSGQAIQASVSSGVVTLNGSVTSDTARTIATGDVAQIAGVKTVIDNLTVQAAPAISRGCASTSSRCRHRSTPFACVLREDCKAECDGSGCPSSARA